jgi:hypothetical protein
VVRYTCDGVIFRNDVASSRGCGIVVCSCVSGDHWSGFKEELTLTRQ